MFRPNLLKALDNPMVMGMEVQWGAMRRDIMHYVQELSAQAKSSAVFRRKTT